MVCPRKLRFPSHNDGKKAVVRTALVMLICNHMYCLEAVWENGGAAELYRCTALGTRSSRYLISRL